MNSARRVVRIGLLVVGVLGTIGCAHQPASWVQPPLAPEVRSQLGTIGVVWAGADPGFSYVTPVKGGLAGAGQGAGAAMEGWFGRAKGSGGGDLLGLVGFAFLGVTAVPLIGASVGAIAAPSASAVEEAEVALKQARAELWTLERLQGRVLDAVQAQTPYTFVGLTRPMPTAPPAEGEPLPETPSRAFATTGVTTIMELQTDTVWLGPEETGTYINPDLRLKLRLRCRLLRTADNEVLYDSEATYRSAEARTLVAWGADGARAFRAQMDAGAREVIAKILDRLFLAATPAAQPAESPKDAEKM